MLTRFPVSNDAYRCKPGITIPMCIKDSNKAIPVNTSDKKTSQNISTSRT